MSSYTIVGFIFVAWAIWVVYKTHKIPSRKSLAMAGAIYLTALASIAPSMPIILGTFVLALLVVADYVRADWNLRSFFIGLLYGVSLQLAAAILTWGTPRPPLLSLNASQVAQTGLVFWLIVPELKFGERWAGWFPAALLIGVSVARAPIASVLLYFFARPCKQFGLMLVALISVFVFASHSQGNLQRFMPDTVKEAAESRLALLGFPDLKLPDIKLPDRANEDRESVMVPAPTAAVATDNVVLPEPTQNLTAIAVTERLAPDKQVIRTGTDLLTGRDISETPITKETSFGWNGYGLGNYVNVTGLIRPHNIFVLLYWEMGLLAVVPVFLLGWAVFTRRMPFSVFLALVLLWQFTEEAAGRVEGFFTTAAVLVAVWRTRPPANRLLAAIGQRLRFATPLTR